MSEETGKVDDVSLMFEAARSFIGGAKIIIASEGIQDDGAVRHPTLPVTVCSAIAIEILLKAFFSIHGVPRPDGDGHDLKRLFEHLPKCVQAALLQFQGAYTGVSPEDAVVTLFEQKDAFKRWRYPYEKEELETVPAFLCSFALALSDYLKTNHPIERSDNGWLKTVQG